MFDVLRCLLSRLEKQAEELGEERAHRVLAEQRANNQAIQRSDVVTLMEAMASNRKIDAIKQYRQMTGDMLKESKDAVERVMDRFRPRDAA